MTLLAVLCLPVTWCVLLAFADMAGTRYGTRARGEWLLVTGVLILVDCGFISRGMLAPVVALAAGLTVWYLDEAGRE